jgi:hypothetical protein
VKILGWSRGIHRYGIRTGRSHLIVAERGRQGPACGATGRTEDEISDTRFIKHSVTCDACRKVWAARVQREAKHD